MTAIALLRHFPTDWNRERRLQGRSDQPLAADAEARLRTLGLPPPWDRAEAVASPLSRARRTLELLRPGAEVRLDPRFVEISWGRWEGRRSEDLAADPAEAFIPTHALGWTGRAPGGETGAEALARVLPALAGIAAAGRPCLIVTHKALMRVILASATGAGTEPGEIEIRRARLYPLRLAPDGSPTAPEPPLRLIPSP